MARSQTDIDAEAFYSGRDRAAASTATTIILVPLDTAQRLEAILLSCHSHFHEVQRHPQLKREHRQMLRIASEIKTAREALSQKIARATTSDPVIRWTADELRERRDHLTALGTHLKSHGERTRVMRQNQHINRLREDVHLAWVVLMAIPNPSPP